MIEPGALTDSVIGIVTEDPPAVSVTAPEYVPTVNTPGLLVTVRLAGDDAVIVPLAGETVSQAPPETVDEVAAKDSVPPPLLDTLTCRDWLPVP